MTPGAEAELARRSLLTLHVLVFSEAACPIGGCACCARPRVEVSPS